MKKINRIFLKILFFVILNFSLNATEENLSIGNTNSKITVKVFSSLTCPHCANFHDNIFYDLKKEYIDKSLVNFKHHGFPLDLAALNAELIVRCHDNNEKSFQLLGEIYKKQKQWAVGSDINKINESLKKIGLKSGLNVDKMEKCLDNESAQDQILEERIEAQKKYKIQSTPSIFINNKIYKGKHNYREFKKVIESFL